MTNADIIIGRMVNNAWTVGDYFSLAPEAPTLDTGRGGVDNLLSRGGGRVGSIGALKCVFLFAFAFVVDILLFERFTRQLSTGDANDLPISITGPTQILLAFQADGNDALVYHGSSSRETATVYFGAPPPAQTGPGGVTVPPTGAPTVPGNGVGPCTLPTPPLVAHVTRRFRMRFNWPASQYWSFPYGFFFKKKKTCW